MLSVGPVVVIIRTLTLVCWALVVLATFPLGDFITDDVVQLLITVASAGTCHFLATRLHDNNRPAAEVYEAGKAMGRAELLREQAAGQRVVSLEDRRRALPRRGLERVVNGSDVLPR